MCMCAGLCTVAQAGEIKRWQRKETNYFHLITYGWGWLKFPCRYSLSGCLEITPDALQIRSGSELHLVHWWMAAYHSEQTTAVNHIDWAWWTFLCQSWCPSTNENVPPFCSPVLVFSARACLTESDRMTGTASRFLRDNSRGKERLDKGREWKSVYPFFFFEQTKVWEFLFCPEWVSGEWHTVKMELCTSICLPRLSVYILTPRIER